MSCLFCQIANKEIPSDIIFEDDRVVVFSDINPKAPSHKLIIPRKHIATINDLTVEDTVLVGHMVQTARQVAGDLGIADAGYRLVFNVNKGAGQDVFHIHLHILGGRAMNWPPG